MARKSDSPADDLGSSGDGNSVGVRQFDSSANHTIIEVLVRTRAIGFNSRRVVRELAK